LCDSGIPLLVVVVAQHQMLQPPNLQPKNEFVLTADEDEDKEEAPLKKRPQGQTHKSPKLKKPRKVAASKDEISQRRAGKNCE